MTAAARGRGERGVWDSLGWVAVGSMIANVAAYAGYLGAGWWLATDDYGQFVRLLSAMLVLSVPALALQAVVARDVVGGIGIDRVRGLTLRTTALVIAALVVAVPAVVVLARVSVGASIAALCAAPLLVVIAAGQGVLQGRGQFRRLARVLAMVGLVRAVPMFGMLAAGGGVQAGLWAGTAGAAVAAVVVWVVVVVGVGVGVGDRADPVPEVSTAPASSTSPTTVVVSAWSVLRASQVQLVLIVAVSIDLLLSGMTLSADDAGVYALGAVATKAAFWLPQAIGVVFYPRLADAARSRESLRQAVLVVAGIGAVLTVAAGAAGPLVPVIVGADYRPLVPVLWLFAYIGATMAVLQVLLLCAIAADRTRVALTTWAVVLVEVIVIVTVVHTLVGLAVTAAVAVTVAVAVTGVLTTMAGPFVSASRVADSASSLRNVAARSAREHLRPPEEHDRARQDGHPKHTGDDRHHPSPNGQRVAEP